MNNFRKPYKAGGHFLWTIDYEPYNMVLLIWKQDHSDFIISSLHFFMTLIN